MSLLESNTNDLQSLLNEVNNLPGGGGASVQSDWNQIDETAADFIKNKPFYDGYNSVKFDGEITLDEGGYAEMLPIGLTAGQLYSILYKGNVYKATAIDLEVIGLSGYFGLGNLDDFEIPGGSDFPFQIVEIPNLGLMLQDYTDSGNTTVRLAVVEGNKIGNTITIEDKIIEMAFYFKVSNAVLTESDLADGYRIEAFVDGEKQILDPSNTRIVTEGSGITINTLAKDYPSVLFIYEYDEALGLTKGTYLIDSSNLPPVPFKIAVKSFTVNNSTVFANKIEHKRMDAKFLPENIVLASPSGKQFNITVDDSGTLTATEVTG